MNNGVQPLSPERKRYPAAPAHSTRSRRAPWSRRRKIVLALVALLLLTPLLVAGWYTWKIASALDDVQNVAVVDLPERSQSVTGPEGDQQPVGTPTAANDPTSLEIAGNLIGTGTGVNAKQPGEVWPGKHELNILVLGVDTRPDGGDQNADVIIIARLDLQERTMHSVSIPRDLLVDIPGHGPGKINGAYNIGISEQPNSRIAGVAKMRDTIEENFGVPIDDYVMIDFQGFEKVVDAVGGIEVDVPAAIHDTEYPTEDYGITTLDIPAGRQHMDGETALAYARTRHGDSDDARRDRQIQVIEALFAKGKSAGSLTRIAPMIVAAGGAVQTSFHFDGQIALAALALNMDQSQIDMTSINQPLIQPGTAADGAWVYVGDIQEISAFIETTLSGNGSSKAAPPSGDVADGS